MPTKRQLIADIILIVTLVAVSLAVSVGIFLSAGEGSVVEVYIDGELAFSVSLSDDGDHPIGEGNVLTVADGYAYMKYADCPDGLCLSQRRISREGERIVCLPNRVVVEVKE